ncbi:acyl carrier protein [Janthinobacterium fluminis]|uniref:Acyl carrier protein n=1 Tax=Janthinobacterium fluminis TaxID=2987524 RepID=A0ABT5JVU5_9BURK|nr:acyl carrier protein [Janthinobacterium fluminis]MDC8756843.1 acyl carrier protein [Janthinobacterium fluminis]
MPHLEAVKHILSTTLGIGQQDLCAETPLLGSVPELDSMAVVGVIAALESHFGIAVDDDEIHARHFATLGSLSDFVHAKLAK